MENDNLFQQAKNAVMNLTNMNTATPEKDLEAVQQVIQDAYKEATPEEVKQLKQMEQQLKQDGHLH